MTVVRSGPNLQAMGIQAPEVDVKVQNEQRAMAEILGENTPPVEPEGELFIMHDQNGREFKQWRKIRGAKVMPETVSGASTPEMAEMRKEIAELKAMLAEAMKR